MKKPADSRDAMAAAGAVSALAALAHASRLGAFRQLVQAGPGGLAVGELRTRLGLPGATLSAHLNVLRGAGLVVDEREGRVIRLRADYARMNGLLDYLTENCCAGAACPPARACAPAGKPATSAVGPAGRVAGKPANRRSPP